MYNLFRNRPAIYKLNFHERYIYFKKSEIYRKCFAILGLQETADQNTVRRTYIELVKKVHPDSGHPDASADKFQEIDNAFKILLEKFAKNRRGIVDDEEEKIFDIKHTAPQHRQYLDFDGIGMGTPSQRQRQYQQVKAIKAQERVLEHRVQKAQAGEQALMKKGTFYRTHAIKTKYGFDRVVEDLIQEAMSKGDFDNLSGVGKPLPDAQSQNPYLDFTTHKLNKILLDNGFTPEWITLQRDIREQIQELRRKLSKHRSYLGDTPLSDEDNLKWKLMIFQYEEDISKINKQIDKFNLIVPIMDNQMFRLKLDRIGNEVLEDNTLPRNQQDPQPENKDVKSSQYNSFLSFLGSLF